MKFLVVALSLLTIHAHAVEKDDVEGPISSGGGDLDAIEFVDVMKEMPRVVPLLPALKGKVTAEKFAALAKRFDDSFNKDNDVTNDLVVFSDQPLVFQGVEKAAIFDGQRVTVYRPIWKDYREKKMTSHMRALVLLEGLLALGIEVDRYRAGGNILALPQEDVALQARLITISESTTADQHSCDTQVTYNDPKLPSVNGYTVDFSFMWRTGGRVYNLAYLASAESDAVGLPFLKLTAGWRGERQENPNESVLHVKASSITVSSESASLASGAHSTLFVKREDGTSEQWEWKDGKRGAFLGSRKKQVMPNFDGNSTREITEVIDEDSKAIEACTRTPVLNVWKAILAHPELSQEISAFDAYIDRVTNAELAYEVCRGNEAQDCAGPKKLFDTLSSGSEARWEAIAKKMHALYAKEFQPRNPPKKPKPGTKPKKKKFSAGRAHDDDWERGTDAALEALRRAEKRSQIRELTDEIRKLREHVGRRHSGGWGGGHWRRSWR
jgi:hypothetical protein